jgi:protein-disulfide isomerase
MKALKGSVFAALALVIAGCGGGEEGGNAQATVDKNMPLTQVPAPNGGDWTQTVTQTSEGGFLMGNPAAKVKVIEYGSMTCGHCATFAEEGEPQLVDKYVKSGQVSFEFRNFVRDPADVAAALLARCNGPSAFFPLTDQLFAAQAEWLGKLQGLTPEQQQQMAGMSQEQAVAALGQAAGLDQFVRVRGIPAAKAQSCLADKAGLQRLVDIQAQAVKQHNIQGTPAFLINNSVVAGNPDWQTLEPAIQAALR